MKQRKTPASAVALGGVMAALAVTVMSLGGLIPVATFLCPVVCMLLLKLVARCTSVRIAWAWYGAVMILSLLLSPDKEAAAVFAFLGYYPIVKPKMDRLPLPWLWKGLFFNAVILALYWILLHLVGMAQLVEEFAQMGFVMTVATLILGNVIFFMLDHLLKMRFREK